MIKMYIYNRNKNVIILNFWIYSNIIILQNLAVHMPGVIKEQQ